MGGEGEEGAERDEGLMADWDRGWVLILVRSLVMIWVGKLMGEGLAYP